MLAVLALSPVLAGACSCTGWVPPPPELYTYSSVVFIGHLVGEDRHTIQYMLLRLSQPMGRQYHERDDEIYDVEYTFDVCALWKGPTTGKIILHSGRGTGGDCGIRLRSGGYYLIYTNAMPLGARSMEINGCRPPWEVQKKNGHWQELTPPSQPSESYLSYLYECQDAPSLTNSQ
jgi:hypothetical protein